ncbi:hypothetical protein IFG57_004012 [Salmonella enterica]|nr:hypothetical protein [Salmonella enterica]
MGKVVAPKYKVCYRTADQVSQVSNELAGSFMYFATAQDAMNTGLFCQKILIPVWVLSINDRTDFLGKQFELVKKDSLTAGDLQLVS